MTTQETQTDENATIETTSIQRDAVPVTESPKSIFIDEVPATEHPAIRMDEVFVTELPNIICIDDVPMTESQIQNNGEATMD